MMHLQYDQKIVANQNSLYDLLREINARLKEQDGDKVEKILQKEEELELRKKEAESLRQQIKALKDQEKAILEAKNN